MDIGAKKKNGLKIQNWKFEFEFEFSFLSI